MTQGCAALGVVNADVLVQEVNAPPEFDAVAPRRRIDSVLPAPLLYAVPVVDPTAASVSSSVIVPEQLAEEKTRAVNAYVTPEGPAKTRMFPSVKMTVRLWSVSGSVATSVNVTFRSPSSTT
jgi:hypothetical protein